MQGFKRGVRKRDERPPGSCLELELEGELDGAGAADLMKGVLPSKDASAAQTRPPHRNGLPEVG
jgi:hypothetical protein